MDIPALRIRSPIHRCRRILFLQREFPFSSTRPDSGNFAHLPLEHLLVETDAPAMPLPESHRKYRLPPTPDGSTPNHPANLEVTHAALAEIRGISTTALADAIEKNFYRLFGRNLP
jgi:hypothetical protein